MGPGMVLRVGTGIALPGTHPLPTPGTPPLHHGPVLHPPSVQCRGLNIAVGLISVEQLSLDTHFSDIQGMTEVYNLLRIGRINNHYVIPSFE